MTDGQYSGPWPSQLPTGSFPGMSPHPAPIRPTTVKVAFWLLVVSAVFPVALVPYTLQIVNENIAVSLSQIAAQSRQSLPPGFYQSMLAIMSPMVWVSTIIGVAIGVLLALGIWTGRNWVRILLTVLVGLSLVGSLFSIAIMVAMPSYVGGIYLRMAPIYAFSFGVTALKVVGLVLAWLPPSNIFFAMSKAARTGYVR